MFTRGTGILTHSQMTLFPQGGGAFENAFSWCVYNSNVTMVFVGDIFQIFLISGDPNYPGKLYP